VGAVAADQVAGADLLGPSVAVPEGAGDAVVVGVEGWVTPTRVVSLISYSWLGRKASLPHGSARLRAPVIA